MAKPKQPENIDELIAKAKLGDEPARNALVAWAHEYVRWRVSRYKATATTGQSDIGQDAIERVLGGLSDFREATGDKFEAWLSKIISMRAAECRRFVMRDKRDVRLEIPIADLDPDQEIAKQKSPSQKAADKELWFDIYGAIFSLRESQKRAVVLTQLDGLSVAEAAEAMGKSETAVAGLLQRGIDAVRAQFASPGEADEPREKRPARKAWRTAILAYCRLRDGGRAVDIDSFVLEHAAGDKDLHALLVWLERIRESGGGNRGKKG